MKLITVVAFLVGVSLSSTARADAEVERRLADADQRYASLDYRRAAETYERVASDAHATEAQRITAWERVGICWLVLGQRTLAREAFDRLFKIDQAHVVGDPSLSPRQLALIEEIRKTHPPKPKPETPKPDRTPIVVAPVAPPPPPRRPIWKRWYLWTPIAIGVAGLGVGLGLGLGLHREGPSGTLPPGVVSLGLRE